MGKIAVLVVEDEEIVAADLAGTLGILGYEVAGTAGTGEEAIEMAERLRPQVVLMDIWLQGQSDGIEAAQEIRRRLDVPVIYLTAHSDPATLERAKITGPFGYILKPFDQRDLTTAIQMALFKHQSDRRLRESEQRLNMAKDAAHLGIYDHDIAAGVIHWDDRMRELWGVGADIPITHELFMSGLHPEDRVPTQLAIDRASDPKGDGEFLAEYRVRNLFDQTERWVESNAKAIFAEERCVRFVGIVQDITSRKRYEEDIARLNAILAAKISDLEEANQQLEGFNRMVSHDLRNPLNHIHMACLIIEELNGDKFGEETKDYLHLIGKTVHRMSALIDDLLKFARVNHSDLRRERVNLSEAALSVAECLKATEADRRSDIMVAGGVIVWGDPGLLRVVLENLIGNAWKFTGMREMAVIEFGATEIDGEPAFFVKDNGIGFNSAEAAEIFTPFKRLAESSGFKGHGIGLATVERIIRRHGGKVWAEGVPDKGAAIYFTLP